MKDEICINFFVKDVFLVEHRCRRPRMQVKRPQKILYEKNWKKNVKKKEKKKKKKAIVPVKAYENYIASEKNKKKWRMKFFLIFFFLSFHLQSMSFTPMLHQKKNTPQKN